MVEDFRGKIMEGFLRVDPTATTLPGSPTNSFLTDEVASTCPLLTPSPPTNDLINPLPETDQPSFVIGEELANKLQHVKDDDKAADSVSSSSSALAEPACTTLLNHKHNNYHHITKDENSACEETIGKVQPLQLTFKKPPQDYFFMTWNWPLIRKISLWLFLSGLVAMLGLVIAMISSLPKTCNPQTEWYQGSVFYEIFPASFKDSDGDGIGDFKGISLKASYLKQLNVRAVRLNSIFKSENYPEDYKNSSSLIELAPELGTLQDFKLLAISLRLNNISLILDLPLWPHVKKLQSFPEEIQPANETDHNGPSIEFLKSENLILSNQNDEITQAIIYWIRQGVDGFYLKDLERYVHDEHFTASLRRWKTILGEGKPIIVDYNVFKLAPSNLKNVILNSVALLDVQLHVELGVDALSKEIASLLNGTLFSTQWAPWIHWNMGNVNSIRLANRLNHSNGTLGASLLQMMLPGTSSIFYGDEIGIKQLSDPHGERKDLENLHQLAAMLWEHPDVKFTRKEVLPWMHGDPIEVNFRQFDLVTKMVQLREDSPSIYMRSVFKDGVSKPNAEIKYFQNDLVVIQRWYPRRKNFVVVSNLGTNHRSGDLSKSLYGGEIVVGPSTNSKIESVSFKSISLSPGESVVVVLN
nr:neutral and basic amino acid transport protein rBAT-like [Onthophagus taurus]XP_022918539.1 neutral and basic amino acid transport protein rBAT-like [Onthophagus taurus]